MNNVFKGTGMTDMKDQYLKNTRAVETADAKEMVKDLEGIKDCQVLATKRIESACRKLDQIQALTLENEIQEIGGMEVHCLFQSYLKLCTKIAASNPATSKRAFEMLRTGEWRQ